MKGINGNAKNGVLVNKPRVDELDIVKAIAIMCMVLNHSGAPFQMFLWKFHMAVFFIASGYFFRESSSDSVKSVSRFVVNKFHKNWVPFFGWVVIFTLLHNALARINIIPSGVNVSVIPAPQVYSVREIFLRIAKGALFSYHEDLHGGFWFFKILFLVSCFFCIVDFLLKRVFKLELKVRTIVQVILSVLFLLFGYMCSSRHLDLHGLEYIGSYYCLYYFGSLFARGRKWYKNCKWYVWLLLMLATFGILYWLNPRGAIGYNKNNYTSPQYLLACAISGWLMVYSASVLLNKIPGIRNVLISIGKRTIFVLIFHLSVLKIIQIVEAYIYKQPLFGLTAGPSLHGGALQLILYTVIGTGVPVLIGMMYQNVKKKAQNKLQIRRS